MPVVYIKPVEKVTFNGKLAYYDCPVYIYPNRGGESERESFLISIPIPYIEKDYKQSFWIKRGTAILLSLDDW